MMSRSTSITADLASLAADAATTTSNSRRLQTSFGYSPTGAVDYVDQSVPVANSPTWTNISTFEYISDELGQQVERITDGHGQTFAQKYKYDQTGQLAYSGTAANSEIPPADASLTPRFWDLASNVTGGSATVAPGNLLTTTAGGLARVHDGQGRLVREYLPLAGGETGLKYRDYLWD